MADVNIGLTGAGEKPPPLTLNNVLKAVEGVKNWKHLGLLAYGEAINSIKRQNDSDEACLKALVEKFLLGDGDYPPSWRAVIYSLDEADEVQLADKIKSFGEPVQDPTLTTDNVAQVIELVNDWDSLSRGFISVIISVIPYSRLRAIQQKYSTKIEISTECASYYVHCNPESSWTHLAIRLYYEEEFAAVVKLKLFLPLRDLTITTKKVNDLFSTMKDEEVHRVGGWLHLPYSKTSEIARIYHRPAQKREAYIDVYINEHPHPTWKELSRVLRVAGLFSQADEVERSYVQGSVEEGAMHNHKDLVSIVRRNDFNSAQKILDTQEIDVNAKESDKHEWTPLMWAVYNENLKMVELLLRKGANPNEVAKDRNWTSLMFASRKGDLNIAKALLDGGADANAQTIEGVTALAIAIYEHKTEIARLLIDKGAGVHLPDNNGWSPLIYASSYGNLVLVKLICDGGANVCYQTKMGWSSLTLAVAHGHTSVAKELARRGADLNVLSNTGDAALHLAAGLNHPDIVKELVASGANMEIINKEWMTALMLAAHAGYLDVVEILLQNGANVNAQHKTTGWTAIFIAVWKGRVNILKRLRHEAAVDLKGGLNLLDVAIYYNQVEIITELKVQGLVESEKSDEKIIHAMRILQSHFYTLEDRYSKLLDNPSKQGYSKLRESPSSENLQESQNVQNNELIAAVKEAIQRKGTIEHTIVHGLFVGPARSGKDSLIKRLLNEKPPGEISPSTGIAERVMPVQVNTVECVSAKVDHDQTISRWTRMEYDEEAYDLMIKTSRSYEPDVGHVADDTTESEDVDDTESDTNIREDDSTNIQAKDVAPLKTPSGDNNSKLSDSASNVESALSSFKDVIRNEGMTGIREYYEKTWSLYLTNTGGQKEFQEMLPLLISGPSVFFVTFPLHVNLQDRVLTKYQSSDGVIVDLYLTSPTLIECILQTLATVTAMGTSKQTEQLYQFKSKVFLVGTHKNKLGEASLAETRVDDIEKRIKEIDQQLQKHIRPTLHFTNDLIQFSSKDQMIFTVDNLSDDEEDFVALRSAVERCVLNGGAFANKYPAHWLIFSLVLRHKIQQQIASYDECYSIAQSCGITDEPEFKKALQLIHSTMGVIRYFPYEQDNLKDIVVIDPQILYDLVTDLIVNTFTYDKVGVKKYEDFVHKGIFSHDELVRVTSKRRVGDLLRLERFTTLLTILRMAAPFQDAQGLKKYFLPCALPHAKYQTNEDCHIPEIPPPLLVTFECKYRPMGIAGALIKYLMTNEMNSDIEWELLSDKIFRNEVHLRVGSCDTLRLRFEPTFIEINMLETEVTKRPYLKEKICSEVQQVIQNGIRYISADMKYTSAHPIMTFYCNSVRCQKDRHPGVPIKDGRSLASLKCDRYSSIADLPNGYKMWCSDKRTDQQTFTSASQDHKKATYSEDLVEETSCTQEFCKTVDTGASSNTSLSTTPPMASTENGSQEHPNYTDKDLVKIAENKTPIPTPDDLRDSLAAFISQVVVLLHTVKDEEMIAALKYLSPPVEQRDKPIRWFHGNALFILGIFGGHKAALVQTSKGADCQPELMPALESLPNAQLIITLGFAYGLKSKCNLGDVLVSTSIDGIGNIRLEHGRLKFDEGRVRQTSMSTRALNVFTKGIILWRKFICSTKGRKTKVVAGPLVSSPVLLNDKAALDEYLKNNERFKGGEMEGQEVARAQLIIKEKDKREIDFIVIKGVADFGDGSKAKGWQLTASLAAASYAEEKLRESGGNVYNSYDTGASSNTSSSITPSVAATRSGSQAVDTGAPSNTSLSITPTVAATQSGSQGHSSGGGILFPSDRWDLESLHSMNLDGRSTKIAILDSGIYADHLSLSSKIADGTCTGINFVPTENDWKGSTPSFNHGTAVAAVVGGQSYASNDGNSVPVGVAPKCELIICRITADDKMYYPEAALQYLCTVENLNIVCMSFHIDKIYSTTGTRRLLKQLRERGVICIGAAGNKGEYQPRADFPASDPNVLSVGGLTCDGHIAGMNTSSVVHVYAHGEMIVPTTTSTSAIETGCGTSFAVPMVAGFLSLLIQCTKDPKLYQSPHASCNIEMVSNKYHDLEFLKDLFECNKLCKDKKLIYVIKFLKEIIDRRGENYLLKLIQEEHDPRFSC